MPNVGVDRARRLHSTLAAANKLRKRLSALRSNDLLGGAVKVDTGHERVYLPPALPPCIFAPCKPYRRICRSRGSLCAPWRHLFRYPADRGTLFLERPQKEFRQSIPVDTHAQF